MPSRISRKNNKNKNKNLNRNYRNNNDSVSGTDRYPPRKGNGIRQERLSGDGQTFTLDTPLPKSMWCPESRPFRVVQTTSQQGFLTTSNSNPTFGSIAVGLVNFNQASTFTAMFDQYRIDAIEVWITPQISADISMATGFLCSVIDLDDDTNLTSVAAAQEYSSCVTTPAKTGHYRHFIPHVAMAAYSGAFTSFANVASPWIDAGSPSVVHYGVKVACNTSLAATYSYDTIVKAHFTFRNVH